MTTRRLGVRVFCFGIALFFVFANSIGPAIKAEVISNSNTIIDITDQNVLNTANESVPDPTQEPTETPEPNTPVPETATPTTAPTATPEEAPTATPESSDQPRLPDSSTEPLSETPTAATTDDTSPTLLLSPTPTLIPSDQARQAEGYAYVIRNQTVIMDEASSDSSVLTEISKDDIIYISSRVMVNGETPDNDWLLCHFDTEIGVVQGYIRAEKLTFVGEQERESIIKSLQNEGTTANFEGNLLSKLNCILNISSNVPTTEPSPTDFATINPEALPSGLPTGSRQELCAHL